jgi:type IV pilus assembly protein PilV
LLEILVTLVIVIVGLLGLLGVQVRSHQVELESYQRAQALILLSDFVQRINTNRKAARCYAITDAAAGTPYVGYSNTAASSCTAWGTGDLQARAVADLQAWDALLKGAAETDGGALVGAMIGARGCVSYDDVLDVYRVSIAWQGLIATTEPLTVDAALTCGKDLYGAEAQRRIVSTTLRIADLK